MKKDGQTFLRSFIKGKIAEITFEQMVRKDKEHDYVVLPFGYEYSMPELAKYKKYIGSEQTKLSISSSPDFILISNKSNKPKVWFIEVKYRKSLNNSEILEQAKKISKYWPDTYFFLFTQNKIYFDKCKTIEENLGEINELGERIFSKDYQNKTLEVLKEFIK